jgi:hypothetical protein
MSNNNSKFIDIIGFNNNQIQNVTLHINSKNR